MSSTHSRSSRRTRNARILLVVLFGILLVGNGAFAKFSWWSENPMPFTRGMVVGAVLVTSLLVAAIWCRRMWARYVLIIFNWLIVIVFSAPGLVLLTDRSAGRGTALQEIAAGLLCYIVVNVTLISSGRLRRLATAPGSGG